MTTTMAAPAAADPLSIPFDELNLQVGSRLQLLVTHDVKPVRYFTSLIGYVRDEYLLVKIPFEHGAPVTLHQGEKLTLRTFTGMKVCSFDATLERIFMQPLFYAHLSFPQTIRATSLRMAMRVRVDLAATLTLYPSRGPSLPVRLANLSVGGALVESPQEIVDHAEAVQLSFTLLLHSGENEVLISTEAKVRNRSVRDAEINDAPPSYLYGVEFTSIDPIHRLALQNLIYEALVGSRQKLV